MVRLTVRVHDMSMGTAVQVRPAVRHRARRRRLWALGVAIVLLVISNYMSNRVIPQWAYVPWNLSMAGLLLLVSTRGGAGPVAIGLGIRHWHRPVGVGLLLFGGTAMVFALGMIVPATHDAFLDTRIGGATLLGAAPAIRWRWVPVLGASVAFGLWHILPSMGIGNANSAVGETIGTNPWVTTTAAVLSMTAAGMLMCLMARVGKGSKTTMMLHWATNSLGFLAAWLLLQ